VPCASDGAGAASKSYLTGPTDSLGRSWWDTPTYDCLDRVTSVREGAGLTTIRAYRPEDGVLTGLTTGEAQNMILLKNSLPRNISQNHATETGLASIISCGSIPRRAHPNF
jgi:hypothetical protein